MPVAQKAARGRGWDGLNMNDSASSWGLAAPLAALAPIQHPGSSMMRAAAAARLGGET